MLDIERLRKLPESVLYNALREGAMDGAKIIQRAVQAAAPPHSEKARPKWPHTRDVIIIYERKKKQAQDIGPLTQLLIGPSKKAPQGFWLEHGRKGGYIVKPVKAKMLHWVKNGKHFFAKRVKPGPQSARPWEDKAFESAKESALKAIINRLQQALKGING